MTIAVTGASGFVGRALAATLRRQGYPVIAVSRRPLREGVVVSDYAATPEADVVVHLAEAADRAQVNAGGDAAVRASTRVASELSRRFGERMVYASSAVVYGDRHHAPCTTDAPVAATDAYSRAKLENEQAVLAAGGRVARLANLVGLNMAPHTVASDILDQIPGRGPLRVRDGSAVRDFLSVNDAADALAALAAAPFTGIVNVGSGLAMSVQQLAEMCLRAGHQADRVIESLQTPAVRSYLVLDLAETKARLSWAPARPLQLEFGAILQERCAIRE